MTIRLVKVDDGHYLVPGTDWEVVRDGSGPWWVYHGNEQHAGPFESYVAARAYAIRRR